MKLSYRERVILIVVIVIACLLGGYFFVVSPKMKEANNAKNYMISKQEEEASIKAKLETKTELSNQLRTLRTESKKLHEKFMPIMTTYEIDDYLALLLVKNRIYTNGFLISEPAVEPLEFYVPDVKTLNFDMLRYSDINNHLNLSEDGSTNTSYQQDAADVLTATVTFTYGCKYSNLLKFIEEIRGLDKTLIITEMSVMEGGLAGVPELMNVGMPKGAILNSELASKNVNEDTGVFGAITVKFFMLPGMAEGQR